MSHRHTALSNDPETMQVLFGEIATEMTSFSWPQSGEVASAPNKVSHMRTILSADPEMM
jgi:hypothetical protein